MKKQKLNQIMKDHKPWTVGVSTKRNANSFFYPVQYYKELDLWFGVYKYNGPNWKNIRVEWREGSSRNYHIFDIVKGHAVRISESEINRLIERMKINA